MSSIDPEANLPEAPESRQDYSRRRFMGMATGLLSALLAAFVCIPVIGSIFTPVFRRDQNEGWIPLGGLDQFPEGQFVSADYQSSSKDGWMETGVKQSVWVRRTGSEVVVFSSICSHAGCRVAWKAPQDRFVCPCHGGVYDAEGRVVAGPPPKPLTRYQVKTEQNQVLIKAA